MNRDPITGSNEKVAPVIPGMLYQSGCPASFEEVESAGITAIIGVGGCLQPWRKKWRERIFNRFQRGENNRRAIYAHIPLMDCPNGIDEPATDAAIDLGYNLIQDRPVLVHCDAGHYRSVHVCAGIAARVWDCGGEEAFRGVDKVLFPSRSKPRRSLNLPGWKEHVETFGP